MRVGIDIGAATIKAVVANAGGGRFPLMPDGSPTMPTGVYFDPATSTPMVGTAAYAAGLDQPHLLVTEPHRHLATGQVEVGERTVAIAEVYTAILDVVRRDAGRVTGQAPTSAAIAVPPDWGPKRRAVLEHAAAQAGFTQTAFVVAPAAVAAYVAATTGRPWQPGECVLVCDAGASTLRLTVLQQRPDGLTQLATAQVDDAGGHAVDALISRHLLDRAVGSATWLRPSDNGHQPELDALRLSTRNAKESLALIQHAAVVLPPPHAPAALSRADLAAILEPVHERTAAAVTESLNAADIDPAHLAAVVLTGGGAHLPGLSRTIAEAAGQPAVIAQRADLAAADGALTVTGGLPSPTVSRVQLPNVRPRPADLVRPALIGIASIVTFAFTLMTIWTTGFGRFAADIHVAGELITAAAVLAVFTGWSTAHAVSTLVLAGDTAEPRAAALFLRRAFTIGAGLGSAVAIIYGLAVGALLGAATTEYLTSALVALPIAGLALLIAVLAPAIPPAAVPDWLASLRPAFPPILLGTAGILAMQYAVTQPANVIPGGPGLVIRLGAALTGVAIALTVARNTVVRAAGAVILGLGGLIAASLPNQPLITLAYVAALIWWAATALARTARAAYPTIRARIGR